MRNCDNAPPDTNSIIDTIEVHETQLVLVRININELHLR